MKLPPVTLGLLLLVLACQSALAAPKNVLLARGRTESVVAVDPKHPSLVVAGSNTNYDAPQSGTYPTAYFTSHDGGRTFSFGNVPILRPFTTGADPTVAVSPHGTVFYSYLGETPSYCSGGKSAVLLTTSMDQGRTFRTPTIVDSDPADDKPNLALGRLSNGRTLLVMTWTRWHDYDSEIWYSRSTNGGLTFSKPAMLYASKLDNFGSVPIIGPHGRAYIFWSIFPEKGLSAVTPTQVVMGSSSDGGKHFGNVHGIVPAFPGIPRMVEPGSLRNLTMPAAGVDPKGAIYVAWAKVRQSHGAGVVDSDIVISRSSDSGRNWLRPSPVNDVHHGDRFMPALSVLRDGSFGVAFYDRRSSPQHLDVYAAHVKFDGRLVVSGNVRVNRTYSPVSDIYYIKPGSTCFSPGRFFGDYLGTSPAARDYLGVTWADTQLHVYLETDVWYAKLRLPDVPRHTGVRLAHGSPNRLVQLVTAVGHLVGLG